MKLREIYYIVKPLIPRGVQLSIRRLMCERKRSLYGNVWPIDEQAGASPVWWPGWPDNKKFALVLTHDVEREKGRKRTYELLALEERYGFRSSYNFVAEGYNVLPGMLTYLSKRGFEAGLHGIKHTQNLFASKRIFEEQVDKINFYLKKWGIVGFRTPCMYHNLNWINELNVDYDSSTFDTDPFEPQPDGIQTIFPLWIQGNGSEKGYVELPYTLPQDFTMFILLKEETIDIWKKKLDWIVERGGMALINTHPDYMNFGDSRMEVDEYPVKRYTEFLEYVKEKYEGQFWHALPREMSQYWVDNFLDKEREHLRRNINKIRVCMIVHSKYESDNRVIRYAETLEKRGDDVSVIALGNEEFPYHETINGVKLYRMRRRIYDEKGRVSHLFKLIKFTIKSAVYLTVKHFRTPFQIIHVHNVPDFLVFSALFAKILGAKVILDCHDIVPEFYASKFKGSEKSLIYKALVLVEKLSIALSDHVIVSNHLWQKTLISRSVKKENCTVIMNYPDRSIFYQKKRTRDDGKFVMIYPGTLNWHQGLDIAIKAFNLIKDKVPEAEFHIYGIGNIKIELQAMIENFGLQDRIFLMDLISNEEIAGIMANADIGIVPKRNDPFGDTAFSTKVLEFMALGIPVIVSATAIDKYYFNDSIVRFFKPEDEHDLANSIVELKNRPELREELAANALVFMENYGWDKNKTIYLDLVDSMGRHEE